MTFRDESGPIVRYAPATEGARTGVAKTHRYEVRLDGMARDAIAVFHQRWLQSRSPAEQRLPAACIDGLMYVDVSPLADPPAPETVESMYQFARTEGVRFFDDVLVNDPPPQLVIGLREGYAEDAAVHAIAELTPLFALLLPELQPKSIHDAVLSYCWEDGGTWVYRTEPGCVAQLGTVATESEVLLIADTVGKPLGQTRVILSGIGPPLSTKKTYLLQALRA